MEKLEGMELLGKAVEIDGCKQLVFKLRALKHSIKCNHTPSLIFGDADYKSLPPALWEKVSKFFIKEIDIVVGEKLIMLEDLIK